MPPGPDASKPCILYEIHISSGLHGVLDILPARLVCPWTNQFCQFQNTESVTHVRKHTFSNQFISYFSKIKNASAKAEERVGTNPKVSAGIRRGKFFKDQSPRIQDPSGYQGTKVPVSALPDRRRRPDVIPAVSPVVVQPQPAVVVPTVEVRKTSYDTIRR